MFNFKSLLVTAALTLSASVATAGVIDFTDKDAVGPNGTTMITGSVDGINWKLQAFGGTFRTNTPKPVAGTLTTDFGYELDTENDGIGIIDDEISFPGEYVELSFSKPVKLNWIVLLDHFEPEEISVGVNGLLTAMLASTEPRPGLGFANYDVRPLGDAVIGTVFRFTPDSPNEVGKPDFALAAVQVAAIPLPAGLLLLGGGLGALAVSRRRRKAA